MDASALIEVLTDNPKNYKIIDEFNSSTLAYQAIDSQTQCLTQKNNSTDF